MNEDYFYNKTGEDAEIENLENLLQTFRFEQSEAPILPQKVLVFQPKSRLRTFRVAFAVAASVLIASTIGAITFMSKENKVLVESNEPSVSGQVLPIENPTIIDKKTEFSTEKATYLPVKIKTAKDNTKLLYANIESPRYSAVSLNLSKNRQVSFTKKPEKAAQYNPTDEEKFAYEQLKLALSITSSNLKTVKEKIDNEEDKASDLNKKVVTK
jgi:hypothetical protein